MILRILYINEAFRNFGPGPAVHGWSLVHEIRGRGVEVNIFPRRRPGASDGGPGTKAKLVAGIRRRLPDEAVRFMSGVSRTVVRSGAAFIREQRQADVILARHIAYDWTPWVAARMLDLPLVLEVNAPLFRERALVGRAPAPVLRWMEEVQWRAATHVQVVSTELRTIVHGAGVPLDRIAVVPNGARPRASIVRNRSRNEPVRILFVGGFYPWHGVQDLVHAVARIAAVVPTIHVVLVGGGPESDDVRTLVSQLGIQHLIEMHGRIPHPEVEAQLLAADIAVAPYPPCEPFYFSPLKVFEYMAAGLPIVASRQGQIAEVLEDGVTGFLYPPGSVEALSESLVKLVQDSRLRAQLGAAAQNALASHYTWGHTAAGIIEVCGRAIESHCLTN